MRGLQGDRAVPAVTSVTLDADTWHATEGARLAAEAQERTHLRLVTQQERVEPEAVVAFERIAAEGRSADPFQTPALGAFDRTPPPWHGPKRPVRRDRTTPMPRALWVKYLAEVERRKRVWEKEWTRR